MTDDGTIRIQKIAAHQTVSTELLSMPDLFSRMFAPDTRTEEQKAADWAEYQRAGREARAKVEAVHAANLAAADTQFRRDVLELHGPDFTYSDHGARCEGCDLNGYEVESPEWPCRTYDLAARGLGRNP